MATVVPANSFVSETEATAHVLKGAAADSAQAEAIRMSIASALGRMDAYTGRHLRATNWRQPVTVGATGSGATATLAAETTVRVGDPVFATGASPDTLVTAVASLLSVTTSPNPPANGPLTFGIRPLILDGTGDNALELPEYPLLAAPWAIWTVNVDGSLTAVDLAGARYDYAAGHLVLNQSLPRGEMNVWVECRTGYARPTGDNPGGGQAFYDLQDALLHLVQINWQRYLDQPGEMLDESVGTQSTGSRLQRMPDAVKEKLNNYKRNL